MKETLYELKERHRDEWNALQENKPSDREIIELCDKHWKELQDLIRQIKDF